MRYFFGGSGLNPREPVAWVSNITAGKEPSGRKAMQLMEAVVESENMLKALRHVETDKGSGE